jgi:hypothetical protein
MRITIVCEDKWIVEVREKSKYISKNHLPLTIPASPSGEFPVTHWICVSDFSLSGFKELIEIKKRTEIYTSSPKRVLRELNLKIIKL